MRAGIEKGGSAGSRVHALLPPVVFREPASKWLGTFSASKTTKPTVMVLHARENAPSRPSAEITVGSAPLSSIHLAVLLCPSYRASISGLQPAGLSRQSIMRNPRRAWIHAHIAVLPSSHA